MQTLYTGWKNSCKLGQSNVTKSIKRTGISLTKFLEQLKKYFYNHKLESVRASIKATWKTLKDMLNKYKPPLNYPNSFKDKKQSYNKS